MSTDQLERGEDLREPTPANPRVHDALLST